MAVNDVIFNYDLTKSNECFIYRIMPPLPWWSRGHLQSLQVVFNNLPLRFECACRLPLFPPKLLTDRWGKTQTGPEADKDFARLPIL